MAVPYYGDFAEDDTVNIPFNTFTSDDPSASVTITNLANTDIHIHKDAGVSPRNNAAGITMSIDHDSITGNHLVTIDTNDNTVGGFWVTGSEYQVRIEGTTVDGATINSWIGAFSIERAGGTVALLKLIQAATITNAQGADVATDVALLVGTDGKALISTDAQDLSGTLDVNTKTIEANAITATAINADAITEAKIADNAIAGEHLNATACTKIIDDFETQSQADPTGFHVNVKEVNGTGQTANDNSADINDILADTGELQVDDIPTLIAALPTAVEIQAEMEANGASILDTLRDDLADGGRLDLILDAIKVETAFLDGAVTEPTDVATMTMSIAEMVYALFHRFYHKHTQTATDQKVFNDDDTEFSTSTTADDATTQTVGKHT